MAKRKQPRAKPISLDLLTPEEALAGLMQVKPDEKETPADEQQEQETEPETEDPS